MPNELTDMEYDEVSLVGAGANQESDVVLAKRQPDSDLVFEDISFAIAKGRAIAKHAQHDQQSHGRRGGSSSSGSWDAKQNGSRETGKIKVLGISGMTTVKNGVITSGRYQGRQVYIHNGKNVILARKIAARRGEAGSRERGR